MDIARCVSTFFSARMHDDSYKELEYRDGAILRWKCEFLTPQDIKREVKRMKPQNTAKQHSSPPMQIPI